MKRLMTILSLLIILSIVVEPSSTATAFQGGGGGDSPNTKVKLAGTPAMEADDEHFVADTGGELDQYLYRSDGDGYIRFNIPIKRYYFNTQDAKVKFDENGFLTEAALEHVTNMEILPKTATLILSVWDVDEDDTSCPEVDYVLVNKKRVYKDGSQIKLSGANSTWSTPSFEIPIKYLKFPQTKGTNGKAPKAANNEISIQIDASKCGAPQGYSYWWAVEVDWGAIEIQSPIRPIIFAHGWTGSTTTFSDFEGWMKRDGIPSAGQVDLRRGIYPITTTVEYLKYGFGNKSDGIYDKLKEFGVDKINIFAHSKGGLVTREALRDGALAKHIDNVITFATPHHGTTEAEKEILMFYLCEAIFLPNPLNVVRCFNSSQEFTIDHARDDLNYDCTLPPFYQPWLEPTNCFPKYVKQPNVNYYSFAANRDEAVKPLESTTYPWKADAIPFPNAIIVDQRFDIDSWFFELNHSEILDSQKVYKCAISYLDPKIYNPSNCPDSIVLSDNNGVASADVSSSQDDYQTILSEAGTMTAGEIKTISVNFDSGTTAVFDAYSDSPIMYTLIDPNGQSINPTIAGSDPNITYTSSNDGQIWIYQYQISVPEIGVWKNRLKAIDEASFVVVNQTNSSIQFVHATDKTTYEPGELVTLATALWDGTTSYVGVAFSGSVKNPDDSITTLDFYDDGTHGDTSANDGVYTAQFSISNISGLSIINLSATRDNVMRSSSLSLVAGSQTAQFQQVAVENAVDNNGNGLYDNLNLSVKVNIIQSGHFEFQGTLIDGSGQQVGTGYYSTLGGNQLPTGQQTVVLSFDGGQIYQHGVNGPYTLSSLTITDITGYPVEVDKVNDAYTTESYQYNKFEHPMISLLSGNSDIPVDLNSNNRYDLLRILLNVNVVQSGTYNLNGRLEDKNGKEISWGTGSFYASSGGSYSVQINFNGYDIGNRKADGPYTLKDLSITHSNGNIASIFTKAYTTQTYQHEDFENTLATKKFKSQVTLDGWILESSEISNQGGALNKTGALLYVGDDAQDKQYKSILSFNTANLPNNAVITKVQLKIKVQGFTGGNMFTPTKILGNMLVDIRKPYFGSNANLAVGDFQAGTSKNSVGTLSSVPGTGWRTITVKSTAYEHINLTDKTQFRLRFTKDDDDDLAADYLKIFSGNAPAASRPQLIVEYYVP